MLYSIIPPEVVLDAPAGAAPAAIAEAPLGGGPERLLVRMGPNGAAVVERLIATDPRRYLDPRLAPGAVWRLPPP